MMKNLVLRSTSAISRLLPVQLKQGIYHIPFVSNGIRYILNRSAPSGLQVVEVAGGPLEGKQLYLDLHSEKHYWLGAYEPQLVKTIHRLCRPGMTVYDVGANIGYISLVFADRVGITGRVYAFEPLSANVDRIHMHVSLNHLETVMVVEPVAVTDAEDRCVFLVHSNNSMGRLEGGFGRNIDYAASIEVNSVTLDGFCLGRNNPLPDIIKLDIEGGAVRAMPGMMRVLAEVKPIILVEIHGKEEGTVVWETLTTNHYSVHHMDNEYSRIVSPEDLHWKGFWVAFPPGRLPNN